MLDFYSFRESNELNDIHDEAINNIVKLFSEMSLDNLHEQFYVFCYLLWNGYFSVDKSYAYSNRGILNEVNAIFLGEGCCRHNAGLLSQVLNEQYFAVKFPVGLKKADLQKMILIERKIAHHEQREGVVKSWNHAVTLVSDSNGVFFLDPTILVAGEVLNANKLVCYNGKYVVNRNLLQFDLSERPYYKLRYNRRLSINKNQLESYYKEAQYFCDENQKLFDDFFDDNKKNYEKIKRLVLDK